MRKKYALQNIQLLFDSTLAKFPPKSNLISNFLMQNKVHALLLFLENTCQESHVTNH